ncbi:MAG: flagellar assembly protein A, partial [Brevinema sp.]
MDLLKKLVERDQWAELISDAKEINRLSHSSHIEVFSFSEDEAIKKACQVYNVKHSDLEYEIVSKNIFGFFGWIRIPSRYRFNLKSETMKQNQEKINYNKYNKLAEAKNGSFRIQMRRDGLHLFVFPPEKMGKAVEFDEILQELIHQSYTEFNKELCMQAINSPMKSFIIAPYVKIPNHDATSSIIKSSDEMTATITISKPKSQGRIPDISEILSALKQINVIHGVNTKYIQDILDNNLFDVPLVIAEGTPVEHGQ